MRLVLALAMSVLAVIYGAGAWFFCSQERLARSAPQPTELESGRVRHPEALLGSARDAIDTNDFSPPVLALVEGAFQQVPSYYQPPFLLAAYHANRLEEPERTRESFEAALKRFPANGRIHLAYAQWLWRVRSIFPVASRGSTDSEDVEGVDDVALAGEHLSTAVRLEPELTGQALDVLRRHQVPPERWFDLLPQDGRARWEILKELSKSGRQREALAILREAFPEWTDAAHLRQGAQWALQWSDASLALELARRWQETERPPRSREAERELALITAKACLRLGKKDEAFQVFHAALSRLGASSPAGVGLLCSMAYEYYGRGQIVLAHSLFVEAVAGSPHHAPSRLGLARTYRRLGNGEAAMEQYRRVLRIDPDNAEAQKELEQLMLQRELGR